MKNLRERIEKATGEIIKADEKISNLPEPEKNKYLGSKKFYKDTSTYQGILTEIDQLSNENHLQQAVGFLSLYRQEKINLDDCVESIESLVKEGVNSKDDISRKSGEKYYLMEVELETRLDDSVQNTVISAMASGHAAKKIIAELNQMFIKKAGSKKFFLKLLDAREITRQDFEELQEMSQEMNLKKVVERLHLAAGEGL
ncbi:hypothetical protein ACFL35_18390 [Candidatus Riflebacteria bacterium]